MIVTKTYTHTTDTGLVFTHEVEWEVTDDREEILFASTNGIHSQLTSYALAHPPTEEEILAAKESLAAEKWERRDDRT